jgi:hypothetical protein
MTTLLALCVDQSTEPRYAHDSTSEYSIRKIPKKALASVFSARQKIMQCNKIPKRVRNWSLFSLSLDRQLKHIFLSHHCGMKGSKRRKKRWMMTYWFAGRFAVGILYELLPEGGY